MLNQFLLEKLASDPLDLLTLQEQKKFDDFLANIWMKESSFATIDNSVLVYKDDNFYDLVNNNMIIPIDDQYRNIPIFQVPTTYWYNYINSYETAIKDTTEPDIAQKNIILETGLDIDF